MRGLPMTDRLPALEGIRGLLALYVVIGHLAALADPSAQAGKRSASPDWLVALISPFGHGHLAVSGFIVLSGFCLQLSVYLGNRGKMRRAGDFFRRRAVRLLPAYYACLALSIATCYAVTERLPGMPFRLYLPVTPENVVAHVLLIHNWRPEWMYKLNGVLWSIAVEAQIYLLFPGFVGVLHRFGRPALLVAASLIPAAMLALPGWPKLYGWYVILFAIGMAFASLAYRPPRWLVPRASFGLLLAATGLGWMAVALPARLAIPVLDLGFSVVLGGCCYAVAVAPHAWGTRLLALRPLVGLGLISYSLYLIHHPLQQWTYYLVGAEKMEAATRLAWLTGTLPLVIGLSWVFYRTFERPFLGNRSESGQEGPREPFPVQLPLRVAALAAEGE
ncbi:MAG: acyltransferase [Fimbriimonadaceae bacterium]|nr:acyltransferase [Fimbriimonadaceae bacterium]